MKFWLWTYVIGCSFFIWVCHGCAKKSGCIDPNASNYTIDAEINENCNYPELRLNIRYLTGMDSVSFLLDSTYQTLQGLSFSVQSFSFYLSNFIVFNNEGEESEVLDLLELSDPMVKDDIILWQWRNSTYAIGEYNHPEFSNGFSFHFGLFDEHLNWDPELLELPNGHPLQIQIDSLFIGNGMGYRFGRIVFQVEDMEYDWYLNSSFSLEMVQDIQPVLGQPVDLFLAVDVRSWFENWNIQLPETDLKNLFLQNLQNSIQ